MLIRNKSGNDINLNDLCGITVPANSDIQSSADIDAEIPYSLDLKTNIENGNIVIVDNKGNELTQTESLNFTSDTQLKEPFLGSPSVDDMLLSSKSDGTRSWVEGVTKTYVDTSFIKTDGSNSMDAGYTPTLDQQPATKKYVDDNSSVDLTGYVKADGSVPFTAPVAGVTSSYYSHFATVEYVTNQYFVKRDGSVGFTGAVTGIEPTHPLHLATANYVDTRPYAKLDGSNSFTAPIAGQDPTASVHLATKNYVDNLNNNITITNTILGNQIGIFNNNGTQTHIHENVTTLVQKDSLTYEYTNELKDKVTFNNSPVIAFGKVDPNGTLLKGYGVSVNKTSTGVYKITFNNALSDNNYIINVSYRYPTGVANDDYDICYQNQQNDSFEVLIGDNDNGSADRTPRDNEFMFSVINI